VLYTVTITDYEPGERGRYSEYSMGWTVRGSYPSRGEIFPTRSDRL